MNKKNLFSKKFIGEIITKFLDEEYIELTEEIQKNLKNNNYKAIDIKEFEYFLDSLTYVRYSLFIEDEIANCIGQDAHELGDIIGSILDYTLLGYEATNLENFIDSLYNEILKAFPGTNYEM
tara:strand:- start:52 stop:417 length:366 start_codon:yes stop_codon:yes gene_type:complete